MLSPFHREKLGPREAWRLAPDELSESQTQRPSAPTLAISHLALESHTSEWKGLRPYIAERM